MSTNPLIIQGGMGAGVSSWELARAVSSAGQLGVVSGTALDQILARRLQDGDPGGHMRRALERFPFREMAARIVALYYICGGKGENAPYATLPMHELADARELLELCIAANFVEVFLAREGHNAPVGINYLEKIQIPHLPSLYGAMLAGVDYVLMGAGVPLKIPGVLDGLAEHARVTYPFSVTGAKEGDEGTISFDPRDFIEGGCPPSLRRPRFLAIISSNTLALTMCKRANGRVDGFVIEGHTAGGHNAPPRSKAALKEPGDLQYGERDRVDLEKIRELGLPFWLAGGYGSPEKLREARSQGAAGVQVGTAFAYCVESGLREDYKRAVLEKVAAGAVHVSSDALASPTRFPFKVVELEETMSQADVYAKRPRICDLGFLREAYRAQDGTIGYRCAAEPVSLYVAKGGNAQDAAKKKCLCNSLMSTIGHSQKRKGGLIEQGLVTSGDDLSGIKRFFRPGAGLVYHAADVIAHLLCPTPMVPG